MSVSHASVSSYLRALERQQASLLTLDCPQNAAGSDVQSSGSGPDCFNVATSNDVSVISTQSDVEEGK